MKGAVRELIKARQPHTKYVVEQLLLNTLVVENITTVSLTVLTLLKNTQAQVGAK